MPQFPQLYKRIITVLTLLGYGGDQMKCPLYSSLHGARHVLSTQNVLIMLRAEIITEDFVLMGEASREADWWCAREQAKGLSLGRFKPVI